MPTFILGFDLNKEGSAYQQANKRLSDAIKSLFRQWWHHLDSTWVVLSDLSAVEIRDALAPYLDANDELLVVQSSGIGAWKGFNAEGSSWLQSHL